MHFINILRIQQWSKNVIIFLPAILLKDFTKLQDIEVYLIFFYFSLMVSSTYIFNDIRDVDQDVMHPEKKNRPIAAGKITKKVALNYGLILLFSSFFAAYLLEKYLIIYFFIYLIITTFYSFKFKYIKYLDFLSISALFYIRIAIGDVRLELNITNYFVIFIISALTTIAIGKKYSILMNPSIPQNTKVKKHLEASYREQELKIIFKLISTVVYLTYIAWLYENLNFDIINIIYSIIGLCTLAVFLLNFYKSSEDHQTENFVNWILKPKNLINLLILCLSSLLIIY
jgi:4-hydroxybenzoate polyprenyltransferase